MVSLELPADLVYRYLAVHAVCAVGRGLGVSTEVADALGSAVGEAFNNAVFHATPKEPAARSAALPEPIIEIEIEHDDQSVLVRVRDYGQGFCLDAVPDWHCDPLTIDELPETGMGLFIIRALMTDVRYEPGHPNILSMRRALAPETSRSAGPRPGSAALGLGE